MGTDTLIVAGGGLAGSLAALALAQRRPDVPILLIEEGQSFGGNHIWSFFDSDVDEDAQALVRPLVARRWERYDILFPRRRRTLPTGYNAVTSDLLDAHVRATLRPNQYRLGTRIEALAATHVVLAGGERLEASGVIDARGAANLSALDLGWQKFVGREYLFVEPHGLERPIIMDATVDQADGYRFVYCLPISPLRMLVEDTYYTLDPALDAPALGHRIDAYVHARGWRGSVEREEQGVLPVTMGGDIGALWAEGPQVARLGLRGGFFHPTTGYSLPDAVRNAQLLARQTDFGSRALHALFKREAEQLWRKRGFYRLLNKMLFRAAEPNQRYRVLEHFYRLDPKLISRFYAGRSGAWDKLRILSGKPPVPVARALQALREQRK